MLPEGVEGKAFYWQGVGEESCELFSSVGLLGLCSCDVVQLRMRRLVFFVVCLFFRKLVEKK